jgi:hypothetical protein
MTQRYWDTGTQRLVYPSTPSDCAAPDWDDAGRVHPYGPVL